MTESSNSERLRFGPQEIVDIRLSEIATLPQMRRVFDEDGLEELKGALLTTERTPGDGPLSSDDVNLNNAINVAWLTREQAAAYITENAEYYRIEEDERMTVDDLPWGSDGKVYILIAGERRDIVMNRLAQEHGHDADNVFAAATVYEGITFSDALPMQTRENIYKSPPAVDDARQVDLRFRYLTRNGESPTVRSLATYFGYSETKVRDAIAFAALPEQIQSFASDKLLSYSTVRQLEPLARAYRRYYNAQLAEDIEGSVESELIIVCNKMLSMSLTGNVETKRSQLIEGLRRSIEDQVDTWQPELFFIESEQVESRRAKSTSTLKHDVGAVAMYLARNGNLDQDVIRLFEDAIRLARSSQPVALESLQSDSF